MRFLIITVMTVLSPVILYAADGGVRTLIENGDYEKAYEILMDESDPTMGDEESLYLLGVITPTGKEISKYLKEYMFKYPDGAHIELVRRHLADYYSAQGLSITAGSMYPDVSIMRDSEGLEIYRAGLVKQSVGEYAAAIDLYGLLLERGDQELFGWARLGIADCNLLSGNLETAVSQYRALMDELPNAPAMPFALLGISDAYKRQGKLDRAEHYYDIYLKRFPKTPGAVEMEAAFQEAKPRVESGKLPKALKAGYFVQVGVFGKSDNAKICMRKFKNLGHPARLESFSENGQKYYRVLLGPYNSEQAAQQTKEELENSQREKFLIFIE